MATEIVRLLAASVRHRDTGYDELLMAVAIAPRRGCWSETRWPGCWTPGTPAG
jgi:hypothetical protein